MDDLEHFFLYVLMLSLQIVLLASVNIASYGVGFNMYSYLCQHFDYFHYPHITFAKMKCKYPSILFHWST